MSLCPFIDRCSPTLDSFVYTDDRSGRLTFCFDTRSSTSTIQTSQAVNLSESQDPRLGRFLSSEFEKTPSATSSATSSTRTSSLHETCNVCEPVDTDSHILLNRDQSPPPQYPASEGSSWRPPPFSSLFTPSSYERPGQFAATVEAEASGSAPAAAPAPAYESPAQPFDPDQTASAFRDPVAETKRALPRDTKGEASRKDDEAEPPPAYSEGDSPLSAFAFLMAAAGGAASIITQVQQGGPSINTIGGK